LKKHPWISISVILLFVALLVLLIIMVRPGKEPGKVEEKITERKKPPVPTISVAEKKKRFTKVIIPAVEHVYADLKKRYQRVNDEIAAGATIDDFPVLAKEYRAETTQELLMALKPHPKSIAIAQAAMESSWGTSRFFKEARNVFGVWSFSKNEPRLAAGEKRGNKTIWVKKYDSVEASIRDYYRTLARGDAFKEFRQLKMETDNPYLLVKKLDRYSEKGLEYGRELAEIIRFNKFYTYDEHPVTPLPEAQPEVQPATKAKASPSSGTS
jgi:Bax protein